MNCLEKVRDVIERLDDPDSRVDMDSAITGVRWVVESQDTSVQTGDTVYIVEFYGMENGLEVYMSEEAAERNAEEIREKSGDVEVDVNERVVYSE